jgi:hypothetical protein
MKSCALIVGTTAIVLLVSTVLSNINDCPTETALQRRKVVYPDRKIFARRGEREINRRIIVARSSSSSSTS